MKKNWKIVVKDSIDSDLRRRIKRVLRPTFGIALPGRCSFCSTQTTWIINSSHVCPACSVIHGFSTAARIPDPCEVCGQQGEWCTQSGKVHSLCFTHRDTWFQWTSGTWQGKPDYKKETNLWELAWEENFTKFIISSKAQLQKCDQ
jgi:hypothetical protein